MMANQKDDLHALPNVPGESAFKRGIARARGLGNAVLNIAVTGESGSGKSSFVNAIRGLSDTDEGAAPVDEIECTMQPIAYPHPTLPNVIIWDLPGVGTSAFKASSYAEKMDFEIYDFFIIVSATRFTENDIKLAEEIQKKKKSFYFVRSKLDIDVANAKGRGITEEETPKKIRDYCMENLIKLGHPAGSPVFLITSHDLNRFDFPKLVDSLERDLPELQIKPDRAGKTEGVFSYFMKAIRALIIKHQKPSAPNREIKTTTNIKRDFFHKMPQTELWDPSGVGTTAFNLGPEDKEEVDRAREIIDRFQNVVLNIAVTGESGSGKSSFVNAIRGLSDTSEGAALVNEKECTKEPCVYPHPTLPNVNIWDLPGIGTSAFKASSYAKKMNFEIYDFFIIVSVTRFKENDIKLAEQIWKKKKSFYFVRSKLDIDVANANRRGKTEEETLKKIQDDCMENLIKLGHPAGSPVFLISSHDLTRFDFPTLVDTLERDLPEHKRDALILGLPVYSKESLERKYKMFQNIVWALAILSGGIAAVPVPFLSTTCDIAMAASFLTKCYHSFGLNDKSLIKLGNRVNKPILEKVKESNLIQALAQNERLSRELLLKLCLAGVGELVSLVPVVGSGIAAGISFATTKSVLLTGLEELYNAAKTVIEMAGLN